MCGIIFEIHYSGHSVIKDDKVMQRVKNRGPNCIHIVEVNLGDGVTATFCGTTLWMRGPVITPQPIVNSSGILLFNGDIFNETWDKDANDTLMIMDKLSSQNACKEHVLNELKLLKGPFSIIYFNKSTYDLYFMRDRIGRNTLLFHKCADSIVISSVLGRRYKCIEVPATHVHILNLKSNDITLDPWTNVGDSTVLNVDNWLKTVQVQQSLPDEKFTFDFDDTVDLNDDDGLIEFIQETAQKTRCKLTLLSILLGHCVINKTVKKITELLEKSIKIRLDTQPYICKDCLLHKVGTCEHCTVGILFSGGLDCTILAFMADKYVPNIQSIELINVAFKKENATYDVPDRITGRQSFEELKKLCPTRKWVFMEINVPKEELDTFQKARIGDLVHPRQTILDESLGSALWFAARGQDDFRTSSCRVLLLGSGADELFGGYTRHRNAFKRHGWAGLNKELNLDWKRISFRNLARDNRVISDHGRQSRLPYLDEDLTDYVLKLKPWVKCFPSDVLGQGVGDKLILRLVAFNLHLKEVVTFPKRALQFGSRIANKKEKGSDISKTFIDIE